MPEKPPPSSPDTPDALRARLNDLSEGLPKRLRQCAEFVAANFDRIAFSTVADMAEGAGVQPSAMMRFAQAMGFSGYSEMQRMFRAAYAGPLPVYSERLRLLRDQGAGSPSALLAEFVDVGRASLEGLLKSLDPCQLNTAVAAIAQARIVHIIGLRRSFPAASHLAYSFEKMAVPAMLHTETGGLASRHSIDAKDVLVAISFAPYSEETANLAAFANERGARVIAITDDGLSPLRKLNAIVLTVAESDFGNFRPLAATLTLTLALSVAAGAACGALQDAR